MQVLQFLINLVNAVSSLNHSLGVIMKFCNPSTINITETCFQFFSWFLKINLMTSSRVGASLVRRNRSKSSEPRYLPKHANADGQNIGWLNSPIKAGAVF